MKKGTKTKNLDATQRGLLVIPIRLNILKPSPPPAYIKR